INVQPCNAAPPPAPCPEPVECPPPGGGGPGGPPGPPAEKEPADPLGKLLALMKPVNWADPGVCRELAKDLGDLGDIGAEFVTALTGCDPFTDVCDLTEWAKTFITRADWGVLQGPVAAAAAGIVKVVADVLHRLSGFFKDERQKAIFPEAMSSVLTA